jgi:hypothetical protein
MTIFSAAVDQSSQDNFLRQTFEVGAGFAQPRSARAYASDLKLPAHKMI